MMVESQLRTLIAVACHSIDAWSASAEELLLMTVIAESDAGAYTHQMEHGAANGIFMCEKETFDEIKNSYLGRNVGLVYKILTALHCQKIPDFMDLRYNLLFSAIIARVFYMRFDEPIPDAKDTKALAAYYKKYYNTANGKATVEGTINSYNKYRGLKSLKK